jgi:hypothetical protein
MQRDSNRAKIATQLIDLETAERGTAATADLGAFLVWR